MMAKKLALKDTPLACGIEHNQLVIRIGVDTLAFADKERMQAERIDDGGLPYEITHPRNFASDVAHAMQYEEEDGSTPLAVFLDKMTTAAVDDGSAWITFLDEDATKPEPKQKAAA